MDFIFDHSLLLYLPLYELDGVSLMSKDAYGHSCSVTGAIWTPRGRNFDGLDDYASINNWDNSRLGDTFTIEMWVRSDDLSARQYAIGMSSWGANVFYLRTETSQKLSFSVYGGSEMQTSSTLDADQWYHIVVQVVGGKAQFYLNAIADGSPTTGHNASGSYTLCIGKGHGENEWDGLIGEARIYNRALTPQEIQHNYLATKWRYQ